MKIVISATGRDIESNIDETFHRCLFFLIVDTETNSLKPLENEAREHPDEIGATVGQIVADKGIDAVITTNIGPRAFDALGQYGIKIYHAKGNINNAIQQLEQGKLSEITKATIFK